MLTKMRKGSLGFDGTLADSVCNLGLLVRRTAETLAQGQTVDERHFGFVVFGEDGLRALLSLRTPDHMVLSGSRERVAAVFSPLTTAVEPQHAVGVWDIPSQAHIDYDGQQPVAKILLEDPIDQLAMSHNGLRVALVSGGCLYVYDYKDDLHCIASDNKPGIVRELHFLSHDSIVVGDGSKMQIFEIIS